MATNPSFTSDELVQLDRKTRELALKKTHQLASQQIQQLAKDPRYGPVLASALKGVHDPSKIAKLAQDWAKNFSTDSFEQTAYRMFFSQARAGVEMFSDYLYTNPTAAKFMRVGDIGMNAYKEAANLVDQWEDARVRDSAGVANTLGLAAKSASLVANVVKQTTLAFGQNVPGWMQEASSWINVAAGCGAAIATTGPYAGGFACAAQVMSKVLSFIMPKPTPPDPPKTQQMALFATKHQDQAEAVMKDAIRLSALFKYHYGVKTFKQLLDGMIKGPFAQDILVLWKGPYGGWGGHSLQAGYPAIGGNRSATGVTSRDFVNICFALLGGAGGYMNQGWWFPKPPSKLALDEAVEEPTHKRYSWWGLYKTGQNILQEQGCGKPGIIDPDRPPFVYGDISAATLHAANEAFKQGLSSGIPDYAPSDVVKRLKGATLLANEIINFFTATTLVELETPAGGGIENVAAYLNYTLPVRFWCIADGNFATDPRYGKGKRYPSGYWTLDHPCGFPQNTKIPPSRNWLLSNVKAKNFTAIRELALIRIVSALSYMLMVYHRGDSKTLNKRDMIAGLYDSNQPFVKPLQEPANPKGHSVYQLVSAIKKRNNQLQKIAQKAHKDAKAAVLSTELQQFADPVLSRFSPTASSAASQIASGRIKVETITDVIAKCKKAGGVSIKETDANGTRYRCVPKGSPEAAKARSPEAAKATGGTDAGAGAGVAVAAGAAALLALKLLK